MNELPMLDTFRRVLRLKSHDWLTHDLIAWVQVVFKLKRFRTRKSRSARHNWNADISRSNNKNHNIDNDVRLPWCLREILNRTFLLFLNMNRWWSNRRSTTQDSIEMNHQSINHRAVQELIPVSGFSFSIFCWLNGSTLNETAGINREFN